MNSSQQSSKKSDMSYRFKLSTKARSVNRATCTVLCDGSSPAVSIVRMQVCRHTQTHTHTLQKPTICMGRECSHAHTHTHAKLPCLCACVYVCVGIGSILLEFELKIQTAHVAAVPYCFFWSCACVSQLNFHPSDEKLVFIGIQ